MRVLLSTIGSRGDVQPLVALALQLRALGQEVRLCVPPDFRESIEDLGLPVTPIGPELRKFAASTPTAPLGLPSAELRRQLVDGTVATQFETIMAAAEGCDVIVGATALQVAGRSIAELMGIPYVFAAYCPVVLPSPHHAPPPLPIPGQMPSPANADNRELWARDAERVNGTFGAALNAHRASRGLAPVSDVRSHMFTDRPWLPADPTLAPWPEPGDQAVFQTGAWMLPDPRPLSPELSRFLDTGEPPIYFGFGSMRATQDLGQVMVQTARALGRRAIVSSGWADLSLVDDEPDCLAVDDMNLSDEARRRAQELLRLVGGGRAHSGPELRTAQPAPCSRSST
jgi:vancomycin aglycone glucosyltransferase